jgi:Fe-S-cluster formation regulator IscX/YfhJ
MPALSTVFLWLSKHKEFSDQYARAKEMQMEAMAEEILQIADSADAETYNPARLQVDTRKWLMSKMAPKRYGDKIEHTGDLSIKTVLVPSPAKELEARPPALPAFDDDPTES